MNPELALKKYERLAVLNPKDGKAHFALGLLYDAKENYVQAAKSFQNAVGISPQGPAVLFFNGSLLVRYAGKIELAIQQWIKAIELDVKFSSRLEQTIPEDVDYPLKSRMMETVAAFEREIEHSPGNAYLTACYAFAAGMCIGFDEGLALFEKYHKLISPHAIGLCLQGYLYCTGERWEEGCKVLEKAIELDRSIPNPLLFLAQSYLKTGRIPSAVKILDRLRELDPRHEKAAELLAEIYFKQGKFQQAAQILQQIVQHNPKNGKAHFLIGRCKQEMYRLEEAVAAYRIAVQQDEEGRSEAALHLGVALTRLGKWQEAIESLKQVVEANARDSYALYNLGLAYNQVGDYSEAASAFQQALSINPRDAFVHYNLGLAHEKTDNLVSAIESYKQAIAISPEETYARYHLALCYQRLGEYTLAMAELEKVLEYNPQDAYAAYNLGSVYAHLNLPDKALHAYAKASELNPNNLYAHFNIGAILARDGLVVQAHDAFRKALDLTPKDDAELALYSTLLSQMAANIEIAKLNQKLKDSYFDTVKAIIGCLDAKDTYTAGHTNRVSVIATEIGKALNLTKDETDSLAIAAALHDIGKVGVPDAILLKQGKLTQEEFQLMKEHPVSGAKILENISFPWTHVVDYVKHHHERYDGTGYPDQLKGEEIPIGARILAIADFFDALATERPYKKAYPIPVVVEQAELQSEKSFDPKIVDAMKKVAGKLESLYGPADTLSEVPTWESSLVDSA